MPSDSLKDALINAGVTTAEDFDKREQKRKGKTDSVKHYQLRKQKRLALVLFPLNRFKKPVVYGRWTLKQDMSQIETHCCLCGELLGDYANFSYYDQKTRTTIICDGSQLLAEQELEILIPVIDTSRMVKTILASGVSHNAAIRYRNIYIRGYICIDCLLYYLKNKYLPSFVHPKVKQYVQDQESE